MFGVCKLKLVLAFLVHIVLMIFLAQAFKMKKPNVIFALCEYGLCAELVHGRFYTHWMIHCLFEPHLFFSSSCKFSSKSALQQSHRNI
ncbi:hypothetical protein L6452_23483 [Arctium lappa]|uniref:Uncharacterized protein n=1 Tax=Arctium lappa TaxID=4217 RepID=A0ACB9B2V8_ARCLA|nr:hypothetical protein L6452_23483 [Arctium lappa]